MDSGCGRSVKLSVCEHRAFTDYFIRKSQHVSFDSERCVFALLGFQIDFCHFQFLQTLQMASCWGSKFFAAANVLKNFGAVGLKHFHELLSVHPS